MPLTQQSLHDFPATPPLRGVACQAELCCGSDYNMVAVVCVL